MPEVKPPPIDPLPKPKPVTQSQRILNLLRAAGNEGVPNYKLAEYNLGYRGRITELRHEGYNIYCQRQRINDRSTGVWLYFINEESDDYHVDAE